MDIDTKNKISEYFFYYPMKKFGVRDLSRKTKKNTKTVMKYLNYLIQQRIILKTSKSGKYSYYESDRKSPQYYNEKRYLALKKLIRSGLFDYLETKNKKAGIILFGSMWKGNYDMESDIDIFIQENRKKLSIRKYETILNRKINILFEKNTKKLSKGLLKNIRSGYPVKGYLNEQD